jgi:hypothetical protein
VCASLSFFLFSPSSLISLRVVFFSCLLNVSSEDQIKSRNSRVPHLSRQRFVAISQLLMLDWPRIGSPFCLWDEIDFRSTSRTIKQKNMRSSKKKTKNEGSTAMESYFFRWLVCVLLQKSLKEQISEPSCSKFFF